MQKITPVKLIAISTAGYFVYSIIWAAIFSVEFHSGGRRLIDAPLIFSIFAGPAVTLSSTHGAEIWLFATIICLPLIWGVVLQKKLLFKITFAWILAIMWFGLGYLFGRS